MREAAKKKAIPETIPSQADQAEQLAKDVVSVLNNPACPERLHEAITEAVCDLQSIQGILSNVDFLTGVFRAGRTSRLGVKNNC